MMAIRKKKKPVAKRRDNRVRKIIMLAYDDAQILDVVGPLEVFSRTSRWLIDNNRSSYPAYDVEIVASAAGEIIVSSGVRLISSRSYQDVLEPIDTLLVAGGRGFRNAAEDLALLEWLRSIGSRAKRVGSICTGSFVLAAAGLLEGKRATTHWAHCEEFADENDNVKIDKDAIFVSDGNIYTSAGVTTGMDMALSMVEDDWGAPVALAAAKELVLYLKRPGDEAQLSPHLKAQLTETDSISRLQEWILDNLDRDLSVATLAQRASMSERSLFRHFLQDTGMTPCKYVEQVRVLAAQRRLQNGALSIKKVAALCGFQNEEGLRRTFHRIAGVSPNEYRTAKGRN